MNTQIDTCMQQIAALTEIVTTLQDDCTELQQTNAQLLRQNSATNTKLALLHRALEKSYEFRIDQRPIAATTELETSQQISISKPTKWIPHRSRSLDGNTPIRKLSDELGKELETKRA